MYLLMKKKVQTILWLVVIYFAAILSINAQSVPNAQNATNTPNAISKQNEQSAEVAAPAPVNPTFQENIQSQRLVIDDLKSQLSVVQQSLDATQNDNNALTAIRVKAQNINVKIMDTALSFRAPLNDINLRLDQLGEPQKDNPEPKEVTDERSKLKKAKSTINLMVGELEDTSVNCSRLIDRATAKSRELFTRTLTQRVDFTTPLGNKILDASQNASRDFADLLNSWSQFVFQTKLIDFIISFLVPLFFAAIFTIMGYKIIGRVRENAMLEGHDISYLQRLSVAFISTLLPSFIFVLFIHSTLFLLNYFGLVWSELYSVFHAVGGDLIFLFLTVRMSSVILSPKIAQMRLVNIAPTPARILIVLLTGLAFVIGLDYILNTIFRAVTAPLPLTVAKSFISVILVGLLVLAISIVRPRILSETVKSKCWPISIRLILMALGIVPIILAFMGYVGLARFIAQQIVISGAFAVLLYLGIQTGRAVASEGAFAKTLIGRRLVKRYKLEDSTMDQIGLFAGILLNIIALIVCLPPMILQLGFAWADIWATFFHLLTGFQVGNVSISLVAILTGLGFFIISWFLFKGFIAWLDGTVMARGKVDSGVRNSIRTVFGYCGVALSCIIGLSAAGFNLSSLALVAGGLSLGIGFGLQNIVQNFVSGLILLAERPFKVGDYVETGAVTGIVKRISVRATELETFKRQTIIVPNSSLINNNVGNWTHRNKTGRVDLAFTAPTLADPEYIVEILLEIAKSNENILKTPGPSVSFSAFDSNLLTFSLSIYLPDITSTTGVSNAIRFAVYKRFSDEGIN